MKSKTIKIILRKKFDEWVETIQDPEVQELVKNNTIITGGCIASLLLQEDYNDIDCYFRSYAVTKAVANYYVAQFKKNPPPKFKDQTHKVDIFVKEDEGNKRISVVVKSAGIAGETETKDYQYFESTNPESGDAEDYVNKVVEVKEDAKEDSSKPRYRPIFLSTNAITLANKVQLVLRFHGEPEEIHKNYDFDHCKSYWKSWDRELVLPSVALESLLSKELKYSGSLYPICSIIRTRKFLARGWRITAGQYLKMCFQVSQLDLTDFEVMREQLVGVDFAYFDQVMQELQKRDGEKVDGMYLMEVIDKLF
jgi:hypothetical protein